MTPRSGTAAPAKRSSKNAISDFIKLAKSTGAKGSGKLVFALDATMSRQATWDMACRIQGQMFDAVAKSGGLRVQLVYFRGLGECRASKWVANAKALANLMSAIDCRGGQTQISKVLKHTRKEADKEPIAALIYIGDAMEENVDQLCTIAGELGLKGTKAFLFQEGRDPVAESAFREIARLTNGAYLPFNNASASDLAELLSAIAVFASGGIAALESKRTRAATVLLEQLR